MITCVKCKKAKPREAFHANKRKKNGKASWCRGCCKIVGLAWSRKNPTRLRHNLLKRLYGITKEQYDEMERRQNGLCAICGGTSHRDLDVDHCHETGKVRGLLCATCNMALGLFRDNTDNLLKAVSYLQK